MFSHRTGVEFIWFSSQIVIKSVLWFSIWFSIWCSIWFSIWFSMMFHNNHEILPIFKSCGETSESSPTPSECSIFARRRLGWARQRHGATLWGDTTMGRWGVHSMRSLSCWCWRNHLEHTVINSAGWWWLELDCYFSISVGNFIVPIDFHIFQRGWNHQTVMLLIVINSD